MSPQAKMCNYINLILGDLEAKARNPRALAILLDTYGNITEGLGSNFFLVRDRALYTPRTDFVLPGISREVVLQLAAGIGIECHETDLSMFDACNADEALAARNNESDRCSRGGGTRAEGLWAYSPATCSSGFMRQYLLAFISDVIHPGDSRAHGWFAHLPLVTRAGLCTQA